jgi:hypothetical protein
MFQDGHVADFPAWRSAGVSRFEDARQLGNRETHTQRRSYEPHPIEGIRRIYAISSGCSGNRLQQSAPFIVPDCIDTHAGEPGDLPDPHGAFV